MRWASELALRRRMLRTDRLEKVVSKVTATTTVRPCLAAIIEFARTDFHRRVEWEAERMEMNELYFAARSTSVRVPPGGQGRWRMS